MKPDKLADGVYRVSAKVGNRDLFEGIWPIPEGVMLNSYVMKGSEKTVLIDLVKDWDGAAEALDGQLSDLRLGEGEIDYLVINHMEPDHTGSLAAFVKAHPKMEILCSEKAVPLIKHFYKIEKQVRAVKDGEKLELGDKTLQFFMTPNIHWPETMMSYAIEDQILFSCDAFGSFGRYEHCFDDELSEEEEVLLVGETERYYANIVSSFSSFVLRGIDKVGALPIAMVAPSHGIVWRSNPMRIITWYKTLATYMNGPREKEITLVWSSMYGNTAALVPYIVAGAESEGIPVHVLEIPKTHESFVLEKAWRSEGLIIGMPTYEYKMFPPMYHILDILERSHVVGRKAMRFGSFGWSGGAQKQYDAFVASMKWDAVGVVEYQGYPDEEDTRSAYEMAKAMAKSIKNA